MGQEGCKSNWYAWLWSQNSYRTDDKFGTWILCSLTQGCQDFYDTDEFFWKCFNMGHSPHGSERTWDDSWRLWYPITLLVIPRQLLMTLKHVHICELTGLVLSLKNELIVQAVTLHYIAKLVPLWYNVYLQWFYSASCGTMCAMIMLLFYTDYGTICTMQIL